MEGLVGVDVDWSILPLLCVFLGENSLVRLDIYQKCQSCDMSGLTRVG